MLHKKHVDLILDFCNATYAKEQIEGKWWVLDVKSEDGAEARGQVQTRDDETVTIIIGPDEATTFRKDDIASIALSVE